MIRHLSIYLKDTSIRTMDDLQDAMEDSRGHWRLEVGGQLGHGVNAAVHPAVLLTDPQTQTELSQKDLPTDLVVRLPDTQSRDDEDKAVDQFETYTEAWETLWLIHPLPGEIMRPVFCEKGLVAPSVLLEPAPGVSLPRRALKRGDAVFSRLRGESVWKLWTTKKLPDFNEWRASLHLFVDALGQSDVLCRDWHSENVLLSKDSLGAWRLGIVDPGAIVLSKRAAWKSGSGQLIPYFDFEKRAMATSLLGVQDLLLVAVNLDRQDFWNEFGELAGRDRLYATVFPRALKKA